jgi:branched-chain amino acid transport system ATP-binding protein
VSVPVLEMAGVHAGYGPIRALKGVDLRVEEGEIVALIGANGAGKTTALMAVSQVIRATEGSIRLRGAELVGLPVHEVVERGVCHVPEGRRIFPRLTVRENLEMGAFLVRDGGRIRARLEEVFGIFPLLRDREGQLGGTLSGGEQQMLAIGRALMLDPAILLLDEPSLGLAPLIVRRIFEVISDLRDRGTTVLLVEQNANMALRLADRAYVLETGVITLEGPGPALLEDPRIREAYLGE